MCALCLHFTFSQPRVDRPGNHTLISPREAVKEINLKTTIASFIPISRIFPSAIDMTSKCSDGSADLADKCRLGSSGSEILVSEDTALPQLPKTSIILSTHFPVIYTPRIPPIYHFTTENFFSLRLLAPQTLCILTPPHPLKYYPLSYKKYQNTDRLYPFGPP